MSHVRAKRKHAAAPGGGHCRGQYHDYDYDDESHDEEAEDEEEEEAVYDYQDASDVIVSDEDDDDVKKDDLLPTNQVLPAEYLASLKPAADRRRQMMFMVMDVILQKGGGQTKKTGQRSTDAVLFGRGELGASVCVVVSGWLPYLLIAAPVGWVNTADNCEALRSLLDERLSAYLAMHYEDPGKIIATKPVRQQAKKLGFVCRVSMEAQKSIMGYTEGGPTPHLKIEVAHPHLVRCLHDVFVGYPVPPPPPPSSSSAICSDADDVKRASSSRKKEERIKGTIVRIQPWSGGWPVLGDGYTETFNSNLDAVLQFMVDVGLWGCQWCRMGEEVEAVADHRESYSNNDFNVDGGWANPKISHCDYEYHVGIDALHFIAHEDMPCFAPLRILSFDIEAAGRRGVFPQAEIDPVIQIGIHFHVLADADSETIRPGLKPVLLSFQKCDEIGEEADVFSFDDERMMLLAFKEIVMAFDVDIFTGYNVCGFDFGYLKTRAVTLGCALAEPNDQSLREGEVGEEGERFDLMTRLLKSQGSASSLGIKETEYFSVQMGKQRRVKVSVAGRGVLDMLLAIRNDQSYRLEKYSLDFVSSYFLGDHKKDVHFTQITPMWMEGPASRRMLGEYCLQDAKLPVDLMIKVDSLTQTIEMARAVGVPFDYVMQRGQMIRTTSLLLRRSKERQFIFPNRNPFARQSALAATALTASAASATTSVPNNKNKGYQGATVLEPECGLHRFVGVVDFSAMYPSIMMAHNICASTIILDKHHPLVTGSSSSSSSEDEVLRVCGHVFVSASRVKGLIPDVVETLQICRGKAKKAFAAATDPFKKKIARASELAYKAASNSVYGFFGSDLSILSIKALAESVTAVGRNDIMIVKGMAEKMYPEGLVVYGDTDSVFIRHSLPAEMADGPTVDAVMEASRRTIALADAVNAVMKRPKKLEFEKVYGAMLLLSKKRYGGLLFKPDHKWGTQPPIDIKGLQSQRRDGCPLVRDLVRDCLTSILHTGSHVDAAGLVRLRLLEIMEDKVPLDVYAIQKTLRKSMQDVCHPMQPEEVARVREALHAKKQNSERTASARISGGQTAQLSYAEQDEAIRWKIKLPWRIRVRLPHVMLAYRLRQQDVGAAPVSGDTIRYIVTNNGGIKIWEKVETLESVRMKHTAVDRNYYIQSLRTPILNLFLPIFTQNLKMQQSGGGGETSESEKKRRMHEAALAAAESALFDVIKQRPMLHEPATRKARLEASAIAMAFAKQHKARAAETKKK